MKKSNIFSHAVTFIISVIFALPLLIGPVNAQQMQNINPFYIDFAEAIIMQDNGKMQEIVQAYEGNKKIFSQLLVSSHKTLGVDNLPPLLTIAMLTANAEAFDLIYKNILEESRYNALEDAFVAFPNDPYKTRQSGLAYWIQTKDIGSFMYGYGEAETNGDIIEQLTQALAEFQEDEYIEKVTRNLK